MKEYFDKICGQIDEVRKRSGLSVDSSPTTAGIDRVILSGLNAGFAVREQLGELSNDEVEKLRELIEKLDFEIGSRFEVYTG